MIEVLQFFNSPPIPYLAPFIEHSQFSHTWQPQKTDS